LKVEVRKAQLTKIKFEHMKLSVIIINYNTPRMTIKAIETFKKNVEDFNFEIILIDNNSQEKISTEDVDRLQVKLIQNSKNLGFAKAVNQGMEVSAGDFVLLLNSDVLVKNNSVKQMMDYLENNSMAGIVGPLFYYPNGQHQPSAGKFPSLSREVIRFSMIGKIFFGGTVIYNNFFAIKFFKQPSEVDWLSGGCMLVRRQVIKQIGLLDENYFFGIEDFDYCLRAKKVGWKIMFLPSAEIIHYHGFSSGGRRSTFSLELEADGMDYFLKKHFFQKKFTRFAIKTMYWSKIIILNWLFAIYKK